MASLFRDSIPAFQKREKFLQHVRLGHLVPCTVSPHGGRVLFGEDDDAVADVPGLPGSFIAAKHLGRSVAASRTVKKEDDGVWPVLLAVFRRQVEGVSDLIARD